MEIDLMTGVIAAVAAGGCFILWYRWSQQAPTRNARNVITEMLNDEKHTRKFFPTIRGHVEGLEDDEIRNMLGGMGAVRFDIDGGGELWGLKSRNP